MNGTHASPVVPTCTCMYKLKAGSQYDAGRCVALRHASLKRCRNATRRWNRTKFYSCVANVAFLLPAK